MTPRNTTSPGTIPATLKTLATPIDKLTPYRGNPRRGNLDVLCESLKTHGQYRPVVANKRTGEVLAGNHTLAAAKALGWAQLAVTWVDVDDEEAKRIVLVDNRSNDLAGYDDAELVALLASLPDLTGTGFDDEALKELLAGLDGAAPAALTDPDAAPFPPEQPVSEPGDVWLLGPHRLVVGDGTDPAVVEKACGGGRVADAYVTDPPYNVAYTGKTKDALTIEGDDMDGDTFRTFLTDLFAAAAAHTKDGGPVYVFHAETEGVNFRVAFALAGWSLRQVLVWVKNTMVLGRQDHHWQHEPILYGWKPGAPHAWYGGRALTTLLADDQPEWGKLRKSELVQLITRLHEDSTVLRFDKPARSADHPTMKPVALLASILDRSTRMGDLVLDTCAGSGSLLIAAHGTSRIAALVELDPRYADVICRRYQDHTGTTPILEATRKTHDFTKQAADA